MHNTEYDLIVISGVSGAVGFSVLSELAKWGIPVLCLTRSPSKFDNIRQEIMNPSNIFCVQIDLAVDSATTLELPNTITSLGTNPKILGVHCAANVSWTKQVDELRKANVRGTRTFVDLLNLLGSDWTLLYFSTAYADFDFGAHRNAYEITKAEAESYLCSIHSLQNRIYIIRASLIVGSSTDGFIYRFNGLYTLIRLAATAEVPCIIGENSYSSDIVPIDWVVDQALECIAQDAQKVPAISTFASGIYGGLPISELLTRVQEKVNLRRLAADQDPIPEVTIINRRQYDFLMRSASSWDLERYFSRTKQVTKIMEGYIAHSESYRQIIPEGITSPPPHYSGYIDSVIDFWLDKNEAKVTRNKTPSWMKWQVDGYTSESSD